MNTSSESLKQAIAIAGGPTALARQLSDELGRSVKHYMVCKWVNARVPSEYCRAIERLTGVSCHDLRPDVFGPSPTREAA